MVVHYYSDIQCTYPMGASNGLPNGHPLAVENNVGPMDVPGSRPLDVHYALQWASNGYGFCASGH